jgi:hypothetical protein
MDDKPRLREIAKALEYWALTAFVAGSLVYGMAIGVTDLVNSAV